MSSFEEKIGYSFKNKDLLTQALTHSSYANEKKMKALSDNERLEFLGDAVLEVVSSDFLYKEYPDLPEGKLTKLRASLVCEPTLAYCAMQMGLGSYLLLGKGEDATGGRTRKSILSDALEATIGAIYLDGGIELARGYIMQFILNDIENKQMFSDSKSLLQEKVQASGKELPEYVLVGEFGPDHAKSYEVEVLVDGKSLAKGQGQTKKAAEQEAAYKALLMLKE
ncbi:MAG: ribonuclease III [Lachnospiraceae bacterium]|nr:ribonuclease III [Lachnospiraceae bacterium]